MARKDAVFSLQPPQTGKRREHVVDAAAGQVGPAAGAGKQRVSGKHHIAAQQRHRAGGMARSGQDRDRQAAHPNGVPILIVHRGRQGRKQLAHTAVGFIIHIPMV
ncbi:hypothetical protein SDC9_206034 [bioreactor metagenome]|uniref:Uncharacterized protein n=1 Tax=bioreactor metagenome TaxID=1076179 RepID=A0A645J5C1_9ZZZZ